MQWAVASKRFVRTLFVEDQFVAAAMLEPDQRAFRFATTLDDARAAFDGVETVVGFDPRSDLERLGVATGGRQFVDLTPPVRSRKLNRAGRVLKITPHLVMSSTLGRSNALYDAKKIAADVRAGRMDKVQRRLESDLKSLFALHDYAQGHRFMRLR